MDGVSGCICEPRNSGALLVAMEKFVSLPDSERAEMGVRGRDLMGEQFDKKIVVRTTIEWLMGD